MSLHCPDCGQDVTDGRRCFDYWWSHQQWPPAPRTATNALDDLPCNQKNEDAMKVIPMPPEIQRLQRHDGGLAETARRHSADCRRQEKAREREASALSDSAPAPAQEEEALPVVFCPVCLTEQVDADGFGVLHCAQCGYCTHPSITGDICGICGNHVKD